MIAELRASSLSFPQPLVTRCGAALFAIAQFGRCSKVMVVFFYIFSPSLPSHMPPSSPPWFSRGAGSGGLTLAVRWNLEVGF